MGVSRVTLFRLERLKRNLEEGLIDLNDPVGMEWLCKELKAVAYDIYKECLKRGDKSQMKRAYNIYLQFESMEKLFKHG